MIDIYFLGFEDGFANCVCNDLNMTAQAAFAYRKGFAAGIKAAEQMAY